jgi:heme A synthase
VVTTQVADIDLVVGAGARTQNVGVASVVVSSVVVTYAGLGLLRVLRRRTPHADRTWTVVAALVLVLSLTGPSGAGSLAAGLALGLLHLEVAAVVVGTAVRTAGPRRGRPGRVA